MNRRIFFLFTLLFATSCLFYQCSAPKPYYNPSVSSWEADNIFPQTSPQKTIFLLGDAGKASTTPLEPTFKLLKKHLKNANEQSALLYLGDNLYPAGLPDSADTYRAQAEIYLAAQLDLAKEFPGKAIMVPGNHDWGNGKADGWNNRMNEERFVRSYLESDSVYFPQGGCPGPVEVPLTEDLVLLLIDTQWWLHPHDKPDETSDCGTATDGEFLMALHEAILRNYKKKIVVAAHHPMYSNSLHGGHAPLKNHLFPLTDFAKKAYVPLPGLGSIYVFYRTVLGNIQDIPHPRYKQMRDALTSVFQLHPNLMYVNGHDHALQYHLKDEVHYITSGAGCKQTYVAKRKKAQFAFAQKGFARLDFFENGEAWLTFYTPTADGNEGEIVFQKKLFTDTPTPESGELGKPGIDYGGETATVAANPQLAAKGFKRWFLGSNYRAEWTQPIGNTPYFDIAKERGGMTILQKGGGMQTRSLRLGLQSDLEKQYVLRSIEKYPEKAIPLVLRNTIAAEIVEDQISASHPYAAFVIPDLAEAVGVYHTNPKLVYVPRDPRMGIYAADFVPGLYLHEERPAKDRRDVDSFGNPKDIDGTSTVLENIREDNDDLIDYEHVLRSRLFDLWIGDWDRHDDQWRWAEFKDKKRDVKIYRPIPRDRDQAFFYSDGVLMKIGTRKWGQRKLQGFHDKIRDPVGLGFNARYFDRTFLTEPDWNDWKTMVHYFQENLTDQVIEEAIRQFPPEIYPYSGETIIRKLKARRDQLESSARALYESITKEVDVLGSDKHEFFEVQRLDDDRTRVRVFKMKKKDREKKHLMYERTFLRSETKEIRLYGFGGNDFFQITGEVAKGIKIRIIGGDGEDTVEDSSSISGLGKKTHLYDIRTATTFTSKGEVRNRMANTPEVNRYNRKAFEYNLAIPLLSFNITPDDALFIGGGTQITTHGFRKAPFKARHTLLGNFAPKTTSFNLEYLGEFTKVIGNWDLVLDAEIKSPNFVDFFYGFGNETENQVETQGNEFNRVRYEQVILKPSLRHTSANLKHQFSLGYYLQIISLEDDDDPSRFIYQPESGLDQEDLNQTRVFDGAFFNYQLDTRNDKTVPTEGIHFTAGVGRITGADEAQRQEIEFTQLRGDFSLYLSLGKYQRLTWATRVGGAANLGDYAFFQANTLGGQRNLRGFRRMRFAGDHSVYWNNDLRLQLFELKTYLFPFKVGITGIYDVGRVWYNDESSRDPSVSDGSSEKWHRGYGAGIWFTPFEATVIHFDLTTSDDQDNLLPFVRFGFLF